jgi:hypothetical protein
MGYATTTPNQPPLLVADDDSLAINSQQGEPKEFYAAPTVISNARRSLQIAAARRAVCGRQPGHAGTGKQLVMVQPKLREEQAPGRDEFAVLANTICGTRRRRSWPVSRTRRSERERRDDSALDITGSQAVGGVHELGGKLAGGDVSIGEAKKTLAEGKSEAVQTPELAGKEYGLSLHGGAAATRARALGLNEGASAGVGEGYLTQTVGSMEGTDVDFTSGAARRRDFVWGYHFSSVIAESLNTPTRSRWRTTRVRVIGSRGARCFWRS